MRVLLRKNWVAIKASKQATPIYEEGRRAWATRVRFKISYDSDSFYTLTLQVCLQPVPCQNTSTNKARKHTKYVCKRCKRCRQNPHQSDQSGPTSRGRTCLGPRRLVYLQVRTPGFILILRFVLTRQIAVLLTSRRIA